MASILLGRVLYCGTCETWSVPLATNLRRSRRNPEISVTPVSAFRGPLRKQRLRANAMPTVSYLALGPVDEGSDMEAHEGYADHLFRYGKEGARRT